MVRTGFVVALSILTVLAQPARAGAGFADRLDHFIESSLETVGTTPGVAVCVVRRDRPLYVKGFGLRDVERGLPVTPQTAFYVASVTKSFTGMAASVLVGQGRIDLNAPVTRYLSDLTLPAPLRADEVTILDLLTHRTGIMNVPVQRTLAFERSLDRREFLELMASASEPMTREFEYSNLGYNVMGFVIEAVAGEPWQDVLAATVLRPVGMEGTTTHIEAAADGDFAFPYKLEGGAFEREELKTDATMHAAGGLVITAADAARWLMANLNDGVVDGRAVLDPDAVRRAHEKYAATDLQFYRFHRQGYALGWYHADFDGELLMHHFGGFAGYHAHTSFMPERGIGVAVFINSNSHDAGMMAHMIATYAYESLLERPDVENRYATLRDDFARDSAARVRLADGVDECIGMFAAGQAGDATAKLLATLKEAHRAGVLEEGQVNNLGYSLLKRGLTESAIEVFSYNVEINADSPNVHDSLGEAYEAAGRLPLARDAYRRAVELAGSTDSRDRDLYREHLERVLERMD